MVVSVRKGLKMRNGVVIKHEQYGLRIRLDEEMPWDALLQEVREKFTASSRFFENAVLTLTFDGRILSEEEENALIDIIEEVTDIRILCVFTEDAERGNLFIRVGEAAADYLIRQREERMAQEKTDVPLPAEDPAEDIASVQKPETSGAAASGERYQILARTLHSGEIFRTPKTVIVLGDVEEGAALTTAKDAIILGSARGVIRAGEEHLPGRSYFVAASDLRPKKLSVDGRVMRTRSRWFGRPFPAVAAVQGDSVTAVPFDGDVEGLLRPETNESDTPEENRNS